MMSKLNVLKTIFVSNVCKRQNLPITMYDGVRALGTVKLNTSSDQKSTSYSRKLLYAIGGSIGIAIAFGFGDRQHFLHECKFVNNFKLFCVEAAEKPTSLRATFNFLADVVEKTSKSVVYIEVTARNPLIGRTVPVSNGSGFVVRSNGLILTNAHVVNHFGYLVVKLHDGREFKGIVEDMDSESDLATVRIEAKSLPELPLGQSSTLRAGEFVLAMGNPLTLCQTVTAGVVSSVNRQGSELGLHKKSDYIQTDAAINVGNSGGPLVNLDGEVIGINTLKVTEGISLAIPSDRAIEFLERIEKKEKGKWTIFSKTPGKKKQKYLGITMLTLTAAVIKDLKERNPDFPSVDHGVLVWRVMLGSPSYEYGIRPGDVISEVNGKQVHSAVDIQNFLEKEDTLHIVVQRSQTKFELTVPLVETIMP